MKKLFSLFLALLLAASCAFFAFAAEDMGYIIVTDYVTLDGTDISADIQAVIDSNPNRTIFSLTVNILFQSRFQR